MNRSHRVSSVLNGCFLLAASANAQIAFLKNNHVFVADSDGKNARQIEHDPREKGNLRWDPIGKRFLYSIRPKDDELGRLAVIDAAGKQVTEISIRPFTDPPTGGMRFPEAISWTPESKIRVEGSINPSKCEQFDLDVKTGQESNWHTGECGTFVPSPDGKHTAGKGLLSHFVPEGQEVNTIELDGEEEFYEGFDDQEFAILAGPVWSPDSQKLAALRRLRVTREAAVVIVDLTGAAKVIPVSASLLDHPAITWVGDKVVAGEGSGAVQVDSRTMQLSQVTSDVSDEMARMGEARRKVAARNKQIESLVKQAGGAEGLALQ